MCTRLTAFIYLAVSTLAAGHARLWISVKAVSSGRAAPRLWTPAHKYLANVPKNAEASPRVLEAAASSRVKAASLLMWSVISSELASLQRRGLQECGKNQCEREERKCVFISVGGAWFPLWSVCGPAPGPPCGQQKPRGHCVSHRGSGMMFGQHLVR